MINATYWSDIMADYSEIDAVTYRSDLDIGERTNGFGSRYGNRCSAEKPIFLRSEVGWHRYFGRTNSAGAKTIRGDGY